jgi:hypothetical protein
MIGQALYNGGGWNHDGAGTTNLYTAVQVRGVQFDTEGGIMIVD